MVSINNGAQWNQILQGLDDLSDSNRKTKYQQIYTSNSSHVETRTGRPAAVAAESRKEDGEDEEEDEETDDSR